MNCMDNFDRSFETENKGKEKEAELKCYKRAVNKGSLIFIEW